MLGSQKIERRISRIMRIVSQMDARTNPHYSQTSPRRRRERRDNLARQGRNPKKPITITFTSTNGADVNVNVVVNVVVDVVVIGLSP